MYSWLTKRVQVFNRLLQVSADSIFKELGTSWQNLFVHASIHMCHCVTPTQPRLKSRIKNACLTRQIQKNMVFLLMSPYNYIWSNTAILFKILLASSAAIVPVLLGHSALFQRLQIQHVILQPPHHQEQDRTACDHHHLRSTPSWRVEDDFCSPQKTVFPMLIWFCLSGPSASSHTKQIL